jgi:hypothetical protein
VLDQVEQRVLGPMDVFEGEHERLVLGHPLDPLAGRPGDLLLAPLALDRLEHAGGKPEQVGDRLVLARFAQLLDRHFERIVIGDPGGGLDHLGERPVRDALAVGQRPARKHGRAFETFDELLREPALADARVAVDREQLRAAIADGAFVRVLQQLELRLAADEGRRDAAALRCAVEHRLGPPRPNPVAEALDLERTNVLGLHPPARQPVRMRADQHLADAGSLLEPGRQGHSFARREGRVAFVDDDLARLHADACLEPELRDRVEHRQRSADRTLGVVLVSLRNSEGGEDGVARELLDDAAVRCNAMRDPLEELRHPPARDLRICSRDERRRIDQVDEENSCQLSFHQPKSMNDRTAVKSPENAGFKPKNRELRISLRSSARLVAARSPGRRERHPPPGTRSDENRRVSAKSSEN